MTKPETTTELKEKEETKEIAKRSSFAILAEDIARNFHEKKGSFLTIKQEDLKKIKEKTDRIMQISVQVSDIILSLSSLRHAPGPMALIATGTKLSNIAYHYLMQRSLVNEEYVDPLDEYLDELGGKWVKLETNKSRIVRILEANHLGKIVEREKEDEDEFEPRERRAGRSQKDQFSCVIHAIVEENDVVWKQSGGKDSWVSKLMIRAEQKEAVLNAIGNLIWQSYGTNHLTVTSTFKREYSSNAMIEFMEDILSADILQSEIGDKIAENTRRFLSYPEIETRAILLYGPPGTGKSTAARYISHVLNMRSLRVGFKLLTETATLVQCLDILRPDVIIIDDIDRSPTDGHLLESLELLRKRARVILASANHPDVLDYAVLRPGRFDEAIKIETLDEKVIRRTVGGELNDEAYNQLKNLPIAYINEFSLRRRVLGEEEAAKCVHELYERIEMGKRATDDLLSKDNYNIVMQQAVQVVQELEKKKKKTSTRRAKRKVGNPPKDTSSEGTSK